MIVDFLKYKSSLLNNSAPKDETIDEFVQSLLIKPRLSSVYSKHPAVAKSSSQYSQYERQSF